jgi:hypothetical protein
MISKVKDFARLCELSYMSQENINELYYKRPYNISNPEYVFYKCYSKPLLNDSTQTSIGNDEDCQVYTCQYNDTIAVVFRGTESIGDVISDLSISRSLFFLPSVKPDLFPLVHTGFYNQFLSVNKSLEQKIDSYIQNNNNNNNQNEIYVKNVKKINNKIIFSGHSLGGAIATMASLYYAYKYPDMDIECITFGSPRVGSKEFANTFNNTIKTSYRFINDNDPVPCLPTAWRFQHVKGCHWLYHDTIKKEITVWRFWRFIKNTSMSFFGYGYNALDDHSCCGYTRDLNICHTEDKTN